jgi:molybdopterin/thiamine biosynthesis adenylyltransferase
MKFTNNDYQRYAKQILLKKIGVAGQKKVMSTKVLVIGVGGLGCPLILYLANSGIRNLGIVDHDKVDISNLNRQVLFTTSDVGKFKVLQAQKIVKKINNKIKVQIFKKKINKKNIKNIISKYDIICDGTDNFETRYLINDNCLKYKKVLISAAISKFDGQIFNFNFKKKTPCYRCFMPEIPNEEINCENDGVMSTLAGIAGTLQANEVMNSIISNKQSANTKMLIFNSISSEYRKVRLSRNPNCIKECIKK